MVSGFGFSGFGFGFCFLKKTSHFLVNSANHQNRARSFHCSAMMDASDCHWGFVLKEMSWLANDVLKERGRHLNQAKKLSKSIDTYHKSKDGRKLKKAKDEIQAMKKISLRISKDVRKFWMKVDKIIAFKQKGEFDEIRQKAMDKHLVFLVKQTERYTYMIAENMRGNTLSIKEREEAEEEKDEFMTTGKRAIDATSATETSNKRVRFLDDCVSVSADKDDVGDEESEEEEEFIGEDEEDDETTLIEEESKEVLISHEEELALLEKDKEMSVEELRAMYANIPDEEEGEEEEGEEVDEGEGAVARGEEGEEDEQDEKSLVEVSAEEKTSMSESAKSSRRHFQNHGCFVDIGRTSNSKGDCAEESEEEEEEFIGEDEEDDETTLIEEESKEVLMSHEEELALLEKDKEMSVEELRAMYANIPDEEEEEEEEGEEVDEGEDEDDDDVCMEMTSVYSDSRKYLKSDERGLGGAGESTTSKDHVGDEESEEEEEFIGEDEEDDETTLIEEENKEVLMSHEEELALLEKDKEMSVEELRAMYANIPDEEEEEEEEDEVDEGEVEIEERGVCEMKAQEAMLGDVTNENALDADSSVNLPASLALKTKEEDGNDFGEALRRLELADEAARSVWVSSYHITIFLFCNLLTGSCRLTALSCWRPLCPCENTSTAVLTG